MNIQNLKRLYRVMEATKILMNNLDDEDTTTNLVVLPQGKVDVSMMMKRWILWQDFSK